ncbi:MAG TPA: CopG family transcriptional regulator [Novosphingobium sp.]|nr:CopG family transcriptional regulator [Novosphingobium sp.]
MPKLNIRLDDALYEQLSRRAYGARLPFSVFCRQVLAQAADPRSSYIYSSQDEILATTIQILSILATHIGRQYPTSLEKGLEEARAILAERGLLAEAKFS